jgi:hypothetical protein
MQAICGSCAALLVAAIYYAWRGRLQQLWQRQQLLRARVAFMLWVMADQAD